MKIGRKETLVDRIEVNDENRDYSNGAVYPNHNNNYSNEEDQEVEDS